MSPISNGCITSPPFIGSGLNAGSLSNSFFGSSTLMILPNPVLTDLPLSPLQLLDLQGESFIVESLFHHRIVCVELGFNGLLFFGLQVDLLEVRRHRNAARLLKRMTGFTVFRIVVPEIGRASCRERV